MKTLALVVGLLLGWAVGWACMVEPEPSTSTHTFGASFSVTGTGVTWAATCGSVTSTGLYTAPPTVDTCRVVASAGGRADTATVTVAAPSVVLAGLALGAFNVAPGAPFTMTLNANSPSNLKTQLAAARAGHYHIFAIPAGGGHAQYLDPVTGHWSLALWKPLGVDRYRADSLVWRDYAKDGTLAGVSINDEPQNAPAWGGQAIPWALMDSAAGLSKQVFRGVPHFTRTNARQFGGYAFRHLDGGMLQYSASMGDVTAWAKAELAEAKLRGYALMVGVNAARGGTVVAGCIVSPVDASACAMSGAELQRDFPILAADSTVVCGLTAWGPDAAWWGTYGVRSDVLAALRSVGAWAAQRGRATCLKR